MIELMASDCGAAGRAKLAANLLLSLLSGPIFLSVSIHFSLADYRANCVSDSVSCFLLFHRLFVSLLVRLSALNSDAPVLIFFRICLVSISAYLSVYSFVRFRLLPFTFSSPLYVSSTCLSVCLKL